MLGVVSELSHQQGYLLVLFRNIELGGDEVGDGSVYQRAFANDRQGNGTVKGGERKLVLMHKTLLMKENSVPPQSIIASLGTEEPFWANKWHFITVTGLTDGQSIKGRESRETGNRGKRKCIELTEVGPKGFRN